MAENYIPNVLTSTEARRLTNEAIIKPELDKLEKLIREEASQGGSSIEVDILPWQVKEVLINRGFDVNDPGGGGKISISWYT